MIIKGFRWVYIIGSIVVIAGVMGFGSISAVTFGMDHHSAILMLGMVPIMTVAYYVAMSPVVKMLSSKISKLTEAMDHVAEGNLSIRIDTKNAGEFKKAYKQFNDMVQELERTKQEMEDFTNEFAHEFKTPITAISGFSGYLLETGEGIETRERMEQLSMIYDESKRLLNLSMNTLMLTKVDAMQVVVEKERYDVMEQIRRCVILISSELDKKEIDLNMDEDLRLPFYGNEELLQHVWMNLLTNAVKFTPEKGMITVNAYQKENSLVIQISDTGVGMSEKTMEKIFDKYYQNDSSSATKGSGIGLSIVKRIVTLCEGEISVESELKKGSTFTVCLPNKEKSEV